MVRTEQQGAVQVIRCDGPLTGEHTEQLTAAIEASTRPGVPMIVLHLANVPFVDSEALEALVDGQLRLERLGGGVRLAAPTQLCRDILEATGLAERFEIFADVKQAVGSFLR